MSYKKLMYIAIFCLSVHPALYCASEMATHPKDLVLTKQDCKQLDTDIKGADATLAKTSNPKQRQKITESKKNQQKLFNQKCIKLK